MYVRAILYAVFHSIRICFEGSKLKIVDQKASDGRVSQFGFQFLRWLTWPPAPKPPAGGGEEEEGGAQGGGAGEARRAPREARPRSEESCWRAATGRVADSLGKKEEKRYRSL